VATLHQFAMAARQLPATVDPPPAADIEGHPLDRVRLALMVVKRARRGNRVAIRRMFGHIPDPLTVQVDGTSIA
jgi:hypothetical protein